MTGSEPKPGVDQQLVIHLYAPAGGPEAEGSYAALRGLWLGCRQFFLMREPIAGIGLPQQLPATVAELTGSARYQGAEETALAAQERTDADCQAILRRHHDVLNLSVVLAGAAGAPPPAPGRSWWQDLDSQWSLLSNRVSASLLGEARVYLARSTAPPGPWLDDLLPMAARVTHWGRARAATEGRLGLWEALPWTDDRSVRRFVLAFDDDAEAHQLASVWAWSRGDTAVPPLARYLLHAAKLRALYREWQDEADLRAHTAGYEPGESLQSAADLRALSKSVEIAEHNMGLAAGTDGLLAPEGPFADDRNLAQWLQARLGDDASYLVIAADRATAGSAHPTVTARSRRAHAAADAGRGTAAPAAADDITRNVFVVHGRDDQATEALAGFLKELGLHPLGWETLVAATGTASPYLRDVIVQGLALAQAAVVLMTPDDTVRLHPLLHLPDDDDHEASPAMQARPNVILELGMALATYADRTIVLVAGKHRPMADLGGINYVRLTDRDDCLDKIRRRLQTAGCQVSDEPTNWCTRAWFSDLAAYSRRPTADRT